jgi:hypothetical protein
METTNACELTKSGSELPAFLTSGAVAHAPGDFQEQLHTHTPTGLIRKGYLAGVIAG